MLRIPLICQKVEWVRVLRAPSRASFSTNGIRSIHPSMRKSSDGMSKLTSSNAIRRGPLTSRSPRKGSLKLSDISTRGDSSAYIASRDRLGRTANEDFEYISEIDLANDDSDYDDSDYDSYVPPPPFQKVLILDRQGPRSCRIIKTCQRLGVKTVVLYCDEDASSIHVRSADESVYIGDIKGEFSVEMLDEIIKRVKSKCNIDSVFPSNGFLSILSGADKLPKYNGISFIGLPTLECINKVNNISAIKQLARQAGFIVVKGYEGAIIDPAHLMSSASEMGFPVVLKSRLSPSRKCVAVANNSTELQAIISNYKDISSCIAKNDIYIERFIADGRILEFQVLCDNFGNIAVFPERDASLRIDRSTCITETPSCSVTTKVRKGISIQVVKFCKALGYNSSGMVKMVLDSKGIFHFIDFRVDADFDATEILTGEDIVEQLMLGARAKALPERLTDNVTVPFEGHVISSRVTARARSDNDTQRCLVTYKEPPAFRDESNNTLVSVDSSTYEGYHMLNIDEATLATITTKANKRATALGLMDNAIDQYVVRGLNNNLQSLRSILRLKGFRNIGSEGKEAKVQSRNAQIAPSKNSTTFHSHENIESDSSSFKYEQTSIKVPLAELTPSEVLELVSISAIMHQNYLDLRWSADRYKHALKSNLPFQFIAKIDSRNINSSTDENDNYGGKVIVDYFEVEILRSIEDCSVNITPFALNSGKMRTEAVSITSFDWLVGNHTCKASVSIKADAQKALSHDRIVQLESFSNSTGYETCFNGSRNVVSLMSMSEFNAERELLKHNPCNQ